VISEDDWGPARKVAEQFFTKIGHLGQPNDAPLWDGETVTASTPANLLHEVAHFQIAPAWRRFKPGYGLGIEPEGVEHPQLATDMRSALEESLASVLGILWQAHLGYEDWPDTAKSHGWNDDACHHRFDDIHDFLRAAEKKRLTLIRLGLITLDGTPKPVLAPRWRVNESDIDSE
jgi:hypothetical protein